jgi:ribonuclease HI
MNEAVIYTDGACSGNPGPGGWGAVLTFGDVVKELHGGERSTTNNRMELMAAISALEALTRPVPVELYTDSKYVLDGITKWLPGWQRNGWKTASKQPVKNVDLWQRLVAAMAPYEVSWHWVKGHNGDPGNERADELARLGISETVLACGGTTPLHPPDHGGASPPHSPPREDTAKTAVPPALWLGLKPCGCCREALHNPQRPHCG